MIVYNEMERGEEGSNHPAALLKTSQGEGHPPRRSSNAIAGGGVGGPPPDAAAA